ncbi:MAG: RNA polymerase sigma factor [Rhodospirillaceae bacterium]|nr:RNA polymerase sigma factor [Rhodospirillaceae bacterium]
MDDIAVKLGPGPTSEDMTDEALMLRVQTGDKEAFRLLVARHIDRIVGTARRIVGAAEAEDIAQDVFLKVWTARDQWAPGHARFRTWLYRVAVNRCIDHLRRNKPGSIDDVPEIEDDTPGPLAQCEQREDATRLRSAMSHLSEHQRTAITLYYHESLTAGEVAEIMGLRLNAVESLLKRGRQKLRTVLK